MNAAEHVAFVEIPGGSRNKYEWDEELGGIVLDRRLFTSPRSLPRTRKTIGLYVRLLDRFLTARPKVGALENQTEWLVP